MEAPIFDKDEIFKQWSEHFLIELRNTEAGLSKIKSDLESLRVGVRKFRNRSAFWGAAAALVIMIVFLILSSVNDMKASRATEIFTINGSQAIVLTVDKQKTSN